MTTILPRQETMLRATDSVFKSCERKCKACQKDFLIQAPDLWTYKIHRAGTGMDYYCCYSCWIKAKKVVAAQKQANVEAYWERMRKKKQRANKRWRDKQNGSAQNV